VRSVLLVLAALGAAWSVVSYLRLPSVAQLERLEKSAPPRSSLMEERLSQARSDGADLHVHHQFVPLARISPVLQRAVVLSEDASFWVHDGVDWTELRRAVATSWERRELGRGASTITMQLARNLYLSDERSLLRKAKEIVVAQRLEEALPKRRLLELYLNYAEWGPGVFGAEAAARAHFDKSAAALDAGEAAVLAAMLPAPRQWSPAHPTPRLVERAWHVADLLATDDKVPARGVRARVEAIVGPRHRRETAGK
jgi:monofunctional biosynthetic peptidoglycan transglycosylase